MDLDVVLDELRGLQEVAYRGGTEDQQIALEEAIRTLSKRRP